MALRNVGMRIPPPDSLAHLPFEAWTVIRVQARPSTAVSKHWQVQGYSDPVSDRFIINLDAKPKRVNVGLAGETVVTEIPITKIGYKKVSKR